MKLQDLCAALPESWVEQLVRTPKVRTLSVYQKRVMLDPYQVGMMRVKEMGIPSVRLTDGQIVEIGKCSIDRKHILVTLTDGKWVVMPLTSHNMKAAKYRGYIVKGKKVIALQQHKSGTLNELMSAYECGTDCPLDMLDAEGLFHAFQGTRTRK